MHLKPVKPMSKQPPKPKSHYQMKQQEQQQPTKALVKVKVDLMKKVSSTA